MLRGINIVDLYGPSYKDRMRHLNLFPSSYGRLQGDPMLVYRIFNDSFSINTSHLFLSSRVDHMRGHSKKVQKTRPISLRLEFRFSHLVVDYGNSLPKHIMSAPSVDTLKTGLNLYSVAN